MLLLLLFLLPILTTSKFLRIEEDIKINEDLYNRLYNGGSRRLGAVDDSQIDIWRNTYSNGQFIIPVTLLEDDFEEGTNSMSTTVADDVFETLEAMADKLGNVIKFVRFDGIDPKPTFYIRIGNFGSGCWSYVGRIPQQFQPQVLNLGSSCIFIDVIEHEMMHALGFFHEQARPDRDDHVTIHWDNIDVSKYANFEKALEIDSRGSPYDYESIMHYTSTAFALDPQFPTITMNNPQEDVYLGSSLVMTDLDMEQIRLLYRCEDSVRSNIATNCIDSCPCRVNEGNCTANSQCAGDLVCVDNRCADLNSTATPTANPTTAIPTSSPITGSPTSSPTPQVTIPTAPTNPPSATNPPTPLSTSSNTFDTDTAIMIGVGATVGIFVLVLVVNVI